MKIFYAILSATLATQLLGTSLVYNFRIAQITKQPIVASEHLHHTVLALPFDQLYKKHTAEYHNYAGGLASYIFKFAHYYLRIDGAVASIIAWEDHTTSFSGKATDDLLFTFGRNLITNNRTILTLSGMFGVPTHAIRTLQHPDFGYGQVGLGLQLDGTYACNSVSSFIYGARYIYFVPRPAYDPDGDKHTFSIGNIGDLLVATKANWEQHGFEVGYTARFDFGARCCPNFDEIVEKTNYIRSSFYAVYKYRFMIRDVPNRFLLNVSYGFDHKPKYFGNKYILTLWAAWDVNF